MSARQLWLIVLSRRRMVVIVTVVFILLTALASLFTTSVYQAETSLLIGFQEDDPVTGRTSQQFVADSYFATQVDLLKSNKVRERAFELLELSEDTKVRNEFEANAPPGVTFSEWVASLWRDKLSVETRASSRVLDLYFEDESSQRATDIANAITRAYRDISLGLTEEPARALQTRYSDFLQSLRDDVSTAQSDLTQARQRLNVIALAEQQGPDTERLRDMNVRLNQLESERDEAQARVRRIQQLKRSGQPLTAQADILDSLYVQELKGRLVKLEARQSELSENLGSRHPSMQSLAAELATVKRGLHEEINAYIESQRGQARIATERESALRQSLTNERVDVLDEQGRRDEVSGYERALEAAKQLYDAALANYDQVLGSSRLQQANVSVLHWASPPESPVRPKFFLNVFIGGFLGLILGLCLALGLELTNRRVRGIDDVERELELEVLGQIPA